MKKYLPIIIAVIIAGGAGFFVGTQLGGGKTANPQPSFGQGNFRGQGTGVAGRGTGSNGGFAAGSIISADSNSITVKLRDGSSKIIFVSSSTEIMKSVQGSISDLAVGDQVTVTGTSNSDGSVTSQSVQIRPAMPVSPGQ